MAGKHDELLQLLDSVDMRAYAEGLIQAGVTTPAACKEAGDAGLFAAGIAKQIHRRKLLRAVADTVSAEQVATQVKRHSGPPAQTASEILTPWLKCGPQPPTMDAELRAFSEFMGPSYWEHKDKCIVLQAVESSVRQCGGSQACVKVIGSRGAGVALPFSGTDLVVEDWQGNTEQLCWALCNTGLQELLRIVPAGITKTSIGFEYNGHNGGRCAASIIFRPSDKSPERALCCTLRKKLGDEGVAVTLLLRAYLCQCMLEDGGLSGVAVATMVAAIKDPMVQEDAGSLLRRALQTYSTWDWARASIGIGCSSGKSHSDPVSILSPHCAVTNLAAGCTKQRAGIISAMFAHALLAIRRTDCPQVGQTKCVTPLSTFLGHKELVQHSTKLRISLWDRRSALLKRVEQERQRSSYALQLAQEMATHAAAMAQPEHGSQDSEPSNSPPPPPLDAAPSRPSSCEPTPAPSPDHQTEDGQNGTQTLPVQPVWTPWGDARIILESNTL